MSLSRCEPTFRSIYIKFDKKTTLHNLIYFSNPQQLLVVAWYEIRGFVVAFTFDTTKTAQQKSLKNLRQTGCVHYMFSSVQLSHIATAQCASKVVSVYEFPWLKTLCWI